MRREMRDRCCRLKQEPHFQKEFALPHQEIDLRMMCSAATCFIRRQINIREHGTKSMSDRWCVRPRHKEVNDKRVAVESGKESLRTEDIEQIWISGIDVSKFHRSICRVARFCTHLETRSSGRKDDAAWRINIKEVSRKVVRG